MNGEEKRLTVQFVLGERGFTQVPDAVRSWSLDGGQAELGKQDWLTG